MRVEIVDTSKGHQLIMFAMQITYRQSFYKSYTLSFKNDNSSQFQIGISRHRCCPAVCKNHCKEKLCFFPLYPTKVLKEPLHKLCIHNDVNIFHFNKEKKKGFKHICPN